MAISYIKTDTDQMACDISRINESIASVKKSMSELSFELEQLNEMWKGEANTAFRMQVSKDFEYMKQLISGFEKFADNMENAQKDYVRCENQVMDTVNGVRI